MDSDFSNKMLHQHDLVLPQAPSASLQYYNLQSCSLESIRIPLNNGCSIAKSTQAYVARFPRPSSIPDYGSLFISSHKIEISR